MTRRTWKRLLGLGLILIGLLMAIVLFRASTTGRDAPSTSFEEEPVAESVPEADQAPLGLVPPAAEGLERRSLAGADSETVGPLEESAETPSVPLSSIRGQVLWPDGSVGKSASVYCERIIERSERGLFFQSTVEADEEGRFQIEGTVPEGSYWVLASAKPELSVGGLGAPRNSWEASLAESNRPYWHGSKEAVPGGQENLSLVLDAGATFRGTVVDDSGAPVQDFSVYTHLMGGTRFQRGGIGSPGLTLEGANGRFEISGFYPAEWTMEVQGLETGGPYENSRRIVFLVPGGDLSGDFVLGRRGRVAGRVVNSDGEGVEKALVEVRQTGNRASKMSRRALTGKDGTFTVEHAPLGVLTVQAEVSGIGRSEKMEIRLAPNEERSDLVLELRPTGRIIGRLRREVGQLPNQTIYLSSQSLSESDTAITDSDGGFLFENVRAGEYCISMRSPYSLRSRRRVSEGGGFPLLSESQVQVREGEDTQVLLGAPEDLPHAVIGSVTRGGLPLSGANLTVITESDDRFYFTDTDDAGRFDLMVASAGLASFDVNHASSKLNAHWQVQLEQSEASVVDFDLPEEAWMISVLGPNRVPSDSNPVTVFSAGHAPRKIRSGRTDERGLAELVAVEPGAYLLLVGAPRRSEMTWSPDSVQSYPQLLNLHLSREALQSTDPTTVQLEEGATLEVEIERASGYGVDGIEFELRYEPPLHALLRSPWEKAPLNGLQTLRGLHPGRARVVTREGDEEAISVPFDLESGVQSRVRVVVDF